MLFVVIYLFVAAVLKLSFPASPGWGYTVLPFCELIVAFLIYSNWHAFKVRCFALSLFTVFSMFSLQKLLGSEDSCGCFGTITIPPGVSLIFNGISLIVLLVGIKSAKHATEKPTRSFIALSVLLVATAFLVRGYRSTSEIEGARKIIKELAQTNGRLEIFSENEFSVYFVDDNCSVCKSVVNDLYSQEPTLPILFVQIRAEGLQNAPLPDSLPPYYYWTAREVEDWISTPKGFQVVLKENSTPVVRSIELPKAQRLR